jgi:hypothetical protein
MYRFDAKAGASFVPLSRIFFFSDGEVDGGVDCLLLRYCVVVMAAD